MPTTCIDRGIHSSGRNAKPSRGRPRAALGLQKALPPNLRRGRNACSASNACRWCNLWISSPARQSSNRLWIAPRLTATSERQRPTQRPLLAPHRQRGHRAASRPRTEAPAPGGTASGGRMHRPCLRWHPPTLIPMICLKPRALNPHLLAPGRPKSPRTETCGNQRLGGRRLCPRWGGSARRRPWCGRGCSVRPRRHHPPLRSRWKPPCHLCGLKSTRYAPLHRTKP